MPRKDPARRKEYLREQYLKNREARLAEAAAYRADPQNRQKQHEYITQWRLDNPNYMKDWHARDPHRRARWRAANIERARQLGRIHSATRRARKLDQFIEDVDPQTVFDMHGGVCGICEQFIDGDFHVDHVIPISKGGMHGYINVQPAHPVCNMRKGNRV